MHASTQYTPIPDAGIEYWNVTSISSGTSMPAFFR